jgi:hypothetical protein
MPQIKTTEERGALIKARIRLAALNIIGKELNKNGSVGLCRPVAKDRAIELRRLGFKCRAKDNFVIKKINSKK